MNPITEPNGRPYRITASYTATYIMCNGSAVQFSTLSTLTSACYPADNYDETLPSWSRDGRWIFFSSKRSGDWQVWKVAATGGAPIQVTKQEGYMAYESADGQFVYYAKGRDVKGIWRISVNSGDEVAVLDSVEGAAANWAVMPDGIYYIEPNTKKGAAIQFFSFSSRRITEVVSFGKVSSVSRP